MIEALTEAGYRVVAPDQFGCGKSPKPDFHYSFHMFAQNTAALLDHLGVGEVAVLGHSTGGMTAVRFTLMNPDRVSHLVLEDPLGFAGASTNIVGPAPVRVRHWDDGTAPTRHNDLKISIVRS